MLHPSGNSYAGEFKYDKKHGKGLLYVAATNTVHKGYWKHGDRITSASPGSVKGKGASKAKEKGQSDLFSLSQTQPEIQSQSLSGSAMRTSLTPSHFQLQLYPSQTAHR